MSTLQPHTRSQTSLQHQLCTGPLVSSQRSLVYFSCGPRQFFSFPCGPGDAERRDTPALEAESPLANAVAYGSGGSGNRPVWSLPRLPRLPHRSHRNRKTHRPPGTLRTYEAGSGLGQALTQVGRALHPGKSPGKGVHPGLGRELRSLHGGR